MTKYFDSSALTKLVAEEKESAALQIFVANNLDSAITSVVGVTEVGIALARLNEKSAERATATRGWIMLPGLAVMTVPLTAALSQSAANIGARLRLRALDAIHVASADAARETLSQVVTYDKAMVAACERLGLRVASPGA